jgi:hypothetical protein
MENYNRRWWEIGDSGRWKMMTDRRWWEIKNNGKYRYQMGGMKYKK